MVLGFTAYYYSKPFIYIYELISSYDNPMKSSYLISKNNLGKKN